MDKGRMKEEATMAGASDLTKGSQYIPQESKDSCLSQQNLPPMTKNSMRHLTRYLSQKRDKLEFGQFLAIENALQANTYAT
jgi:hypothetical protein